MPEWLPLVLSAIGGGGLTSLVSVYLGRHKVRAEASLAGAKGEATLGSAWHAYAETLQERLGFETARVDMLEAESASMRKRLAQQDNEIAYLKNENESLKALLRANGFSPD